MPDTREIRNQKTSPTLEAKHPPTLKDIAFMTGLAVTTVSRALKDAPDIGKATKERVRLVANQIGYRPNRAGVRLRTGKTNVIALVMSIETEPMGLTPHMVTGISRVLAPTSYHLILTPYDNSNDPLDPVRYVVETGSADGIIISRTQQDDSRVRYLHERGFPFATHGRTDMGIQHAYHDYDNAKFAEVAVERLAKMGRKKIAILPPPQELNYGRNMIEGFGIGLDRFDLDEVSLRGAHLELDHDYVRDSIARIVASRNPPDGIICGSSAAVLAVVAGIEAAGFEVGKDVDVIGKESFDLLQKFRPTISVVKESFVDAGVHLANAVIAQINGERAENFQSLEIPE